MRPLTDRQKAILEFINLYIAKYKKGPTFREIGEGFGVHLNTISGHVVNLRRKEMVTTGKKRRSLSLTEKAKCLLMVEKRD